MQPLANRRIGLLTASASRLGGGVFEAVVAQADLIAAQGGTPVVIALEDRHSGDDRQRLGSAEVLTVRPRGPRQVGFAPNLARCLDAAGLDCLHLHGIWMHISAAGAGWSARTGKPYIVSPHGMLDRWIVRRGRWKKALARLGYERKSWRAAWRMHALTPREAADIARETGRTDSIIIPNAGPPAVDRHAPRTETFVYIGRIHPKKNLETLISAWLAAAMPPECRLVIAGWGDPQSVGALESAVAAAGPSVSFVGPVFGQAKQDLLSHARFVVLPSLSEGLPMAILEAWSEGSPVLMSDECNLPVGFAGGAALDCGYSADTIAASLRQAASLDAHDWAAMSEASLALASGEFSPRRVGEIWAGVYGEAIAGASKHRLPGHRRECD